MLTYTDHVNPQLQLWNASNLQPIGSPRKSPDWVDAIAFSPNSKSYVVGNTWWIDFRNTASDQLLRRIPQPDMTLSLAFSSDGQTVFAGCLDRKARLFDARTGKLVGNPLGPFANSPRVFCFPDNQHVLTLSAGQASLWQKPRGQRVRVFSRPNPEEPLSRGQEEMSLSVSGDGSVFVAAGSDP